MGFWSAMVLITLISAITVVALAKYGWFRRHGDAPAGPALAEAEVAGLRAELNQFKDRVAVLERIATENDRGLMLDREIAKLRSLPAE